jgi:ribosome biogenesis SPOUT family RNA methylase Rps3
MKQTIVIEHLESKVWPWCIIEYESISKIIPKDNLWFTNVRDRKLSKFGKVIDKSVLDLDIKNVCILDPDAPKLLDSKDAKNFDYFIIGGILGDYPPRKRTKAELTLKMNGAESRNLGKKQFSTDNAVYVLKEIIEGKELRDIKFQNKLVLKINEIESIELPYYYPLINGKPRISDKLINYLKTKNEF